MAVVLVVLMGAGERKKMGKVAEYIVAGSVIVRFGQALVKVVWMQ